MCGSWNSEAVCSAFCSVLCDEQGSRWIESSEEWFEPVAVSAEPTPRNEKPDAASTSPGLSSAGQRFPARAEQPEKADSARAVFVNYLLIAPA